MLCLLRRTLHELSAVEASPSSTDMYIFATYKVLRLESMDSHQHTKTNRTNCQAPFIATKPSTTQR